MENQRRQILERFLAYQVPSADLTAEIPVAEIMELAFPTSSQNAITLAKKYLCGRDYHYPGGQVGLTPPEITLKPASAKAGNFGAVEIGAGNWNDLSALASTSHFAMLIHECERNYINNEFDELVPKLRFLIAVCETIVETKAGANQDEIPIYQNQLDRSKSLLLRLHLGLDYFGQPYNSVPLLSVKFYKDSLQQILNYARSIEQSYLIYAAKKRDAQAAMSAFRETRAQVISKIVTKKSESQGTQVEQSRLQNEIEFLLLDLSSIWQELFAAENKFKNAIAKMGPGCSFKELVAFGASVATLIGTGGAVAPAISGALAAMKAKQLKDKDGKVIKPGLPSAKYRIERVVEAGQKVEQFIDAFNSVKDIVSPPIQENAIPDLPTDEVKIIASAETIDSELEKYIRLPEAQQYRKLLRRFVSSSQTRNNKIVEYNISVQRWYSLTAEILEAELESDTLLSQIASSNNPFLPEAARFMEKAWREARTSIVRLLYQMERAIRYYSPSERQFSVGDFSIAALESTALALQVEYTRVREQAGTDPQLFQQLKLKISDFVSDEDWKSFKLDGVVTFVIPTGIKEFSRKFAIRVSKLRIELVGGSKKKAFQAVVTHHGHCRVRTENRNWHDFVHRPITFSYEKTSDGVELVDGTIAQKDGDYEGLSPFACWTIALYGLQAEDLRKMQEVIINLDGSQRTIG